MALSDLPGLEPWGALHRLAPELRADVLTYALPVFAINKVDLQRLHLLSSNSDTLSQALNLIRFIFRSTRPEHPSRKDRLHNLSDEEFADSHVLAHRSSYDDYVKGALEVLRYISGIASAILKRFTPVIEEVHKGHETEDETIKLDRSRPLPPKTPATDIPLLLLNRAVSLDCLQHIIDKAMLILTFQGAQWTSLSRSLPLDTFSSVRSCSITILDSVCLLGGGFESRITNGLRELVAKLPNIRHLYIRYEDLLQGASFRTKYALVYGPMKMLREVTSLRSVCFRQGGHLDSTLTCTRPRNRYIWACAQHFSSPDVDRYWVCGCGRT